MKRFHLLGLFPEMFDGYFSQSLLGRAREKGLVEFHYHQLRDWGNPAKVRVTAGNEKAISETQWRGSQMTSRRDKEPLAFELSEQASTASARGGRREPKPETKSKGKRIDDRPYGGGSGMVFMPDVVCRAVRELKSRYGITRVILTSPRGRLLTPALARELAGAPLGDVAPPGDVADGLLFLCARYEGVDQRAIDVVIDDEISIGDYVISGGELAACVIIDAACRFIPGVVGNAASVARDSFEDGLLEYPHFTRPEVFENVAVPPVLLSGDHEAIAAWRRQEALRLTWRRRPELLKKAALTAREREFVKELIHRQR